MVSSIAEEKKVLRRRVREQLNGLSPEEQKTFIEGTHSLRSAKEMRDYVARLNGNIE